MKTLNREELEIWIKNTCPRLRDKVLDDYHKNNER